MRVDELLVFGKQFCHSSHAKFLLADLLGYNPLELLNHLEEVVSPDKVELYKKEVVALKEGKPLQYVIGNTNFCGYLFKVNENVLIPRFETEELVDETLKLINQLFEKPITILDLGTGSGCIGITIKKKLSSSEVTLVDISEKALEVAKENAKELEAKCNFILSDMLENVSGKFNVIISNPPYIKTDEEIEEIVKNNEPHLALYGGVDGLDCYRKILSNIKEYLEEDFLIAFEIGYTQKEDIINLINDSLANVKIIAKKDLQGRDRMIFITRNT